MLELNKILWIQLTHSVLTGNGRFVEQSLVSAITRTFCVTRTVHNLFFVLYNIYYYRTCSFFIHSNSLQRL